MPQELMPITPRDMRQALALCKAKFESEASANRAAVEHVDAREFITRAESLDRMASHVGALLRAPDMPTAPPPCGYVSKLSQESLTWFRGEYLRLAESHMEADSEFERAELNRKADLLFAVAAYRFEGVDIKESA